MRIAIDVRMVGQFMHGISRYAYNLIKGLSEADKRNDYVLLANDNFLGDFVSSRGNFSLRVINSRLYGIREQFTIPRVLREEKIDIFHSPSFFGPVLGGCKVIMTIHDMIHVLFPEESSIFHRAYYRLIVGRAAKNASRILTVSENSRHDISHYLNITSEKIVVTYNAVEKKFWQNDGEKADEIKDSLGINNKYILYVGNQKPHKNLGFLLEAFQQLKGIINHQLVIVGKKDLLFMKGLKKNVQERVRFVGEVSDKFLPYLYSGADLYVSPSLYEGFGLPIIEAFACKTPVIAVNTRCAEEIMGNAGLRVGAGCTDELANVIHKVLTDEGLRNRLIRQGLARVKMFSWEKTVDRTLKVYYEVYKMRTAYKRKTLRSSSLGYNKMRKMRIGLNVSTICDVHTGVGRYTFNLCRSILEADSRNYYYYTSNSMGNTANSAARDVSIGALQDKPRRVTQNNMRRVLWEQVILPFSSRKDRLDLFHYTDHALSLLPRTCPTILTVHDIAFVRFPNLFNKSRQMYKKYIFERSIKRANLIIAPSNSTKKDILHYYGIKEERIKVVSNGIESRFHPIGNVEEYRRRNKLPSKMILNVGTLEPRKNIVTLIKAFKKLSGKGLKEYRLVVAGSKGWLYKQILEEIENSDVSSSILYLDVVNDKNLPELYNCADIFVYPSLYEGFGLPPLEAMACGIPVITSNTSSLPEVVGDAGIMVDPTDVNSLSDAMCKVLKDKELRLRMRNMGLERSKLFSWNNTAKKILKIYDEVLSVHKYQ
ncbi:MAG: glycosyltransferase family 4 protein [Candidatus Brocadiaceae bacterium]|nr:glycosyltransferase family 4 protein [Candidatus Brocadiaceae bacterium]